MDELRRAIEWMEIEKESAQNSWERAGAEWRIEPGTQEMHDEQMAAFDLAIQALRQMKPSEWIPVSERLPEPISQTSGANIKNTYLVARYENCNPKGYFYGYQLARYWKSGWSGIDGSYGLSVTHWMPLPQPPESEEIMKRFTKLLRIEYEDKWVVEDAFEDESGLIRGKAIDCLAQYETANEGLGCEECFGVAGMEIPLSTGIKSVNFCPICGRRF